MHEHVFVRLLPSAGTRDRVCRILEFTGHIRRNQDVWAIPPQVHEGPCARGSGRTTAPPAAHVLLVAVTVPPPR